jgi:hypothetical protein
MDFLSFSLCHSVCISRDANPTGCSSQYVLIVTDVCRSMAERNTSCGILSDIPMSCCVLCQIIFSLDMDIHIQMGVCKKCAYEVKWI